MDKMKPFKDSSFVVIEEEVPIAEAIARYPRHPLASWLLYVARNSRTWHQRVLAAFLRRRGWVVFYLDEPARVCNSICWLKLYEEGEKQHGRK